MTVLRSYVSGAWTDPADDGRPVLDAVTGEEVARVSSAGIDLAAALAYGRSAGGPALRAAFGTHPDGSPGGILGSDELVRTLGAIPLFRHQPDGSLLEDWGSPA